MTLTAGARSLLDYYHAADEQTKQTGRAWYSEMRDIVRLLAEHYALSVDTVAGVVSALSPNTRWSQNISGAGRLIRAWSHGSEQPPRDCTLYYSNALKAWRILRGETTTENAFAKAPKTRAFWQNLAGDENAVTVDVWMLRALGVPEDAAAKGIRTLAQYTRHADDIRQAARAVGETPAAFQAIVWCQIRGERSEDTAGQQAAAATVAGLIPWQPRQLR